MTKIEVTSELMEMLRKKKGLNEEGEEVEGNEDKKEKKRRKKQKKDGKGKKKESEKEENDVECDNDAKVSKDVNEIKEVEDIEETKEKSAKKKKKDKEKKKESKEKKKQKESAKSEKEAEEEGGASCSSPPVAKNESSSTVAETKVKEDKDEEMSKDEDGDDDDVSTPKKNQTLSERARAKRAEAQRLRSTVPTHDENGIAYTKIQIRRMVKRVRNGLNPVLTEDEEKARRKALELEDREVEDELAGQVVRKRPLDDGDDDDNDDAEDGDGTPCTPTSGSVKKVVPSDYVCYACKARAEHWIYDCPQKVHRPGCNRVKKAKVAVDNNNNNAKTGDGEENKKEKTTTKRSGQDQYGDPRRKVFVTGLPFDVRVQRATEYFAEHVGGMDEVVRCSLLYFNDGDSSTGKHKHKGKCNGSAIVTLASDKSVAKALKLDGKAFATKKIEEDGKVKKKVLTLKVCKYRNMTDIQKRGKGKE